MSSSHDGCAVQPPPAIKYCWSTDEECYFGQLDSPEAAVDDAIDNGHCDLEEASTVYVGECVPYDPRLNTTRSLDLIENAQDAAYDEAGECAGEWLCRLPSEVSSELSDRIEAVFRAWLREHDLWPKFYTVKNVKEHKVTQEMLNRVGT